MTTPTDVPDRVKNAFFVGAAVVSVTVAVGNIGHVYEAARHARQGERMATVYAVLPDVLLVLCLLKLKYDGRSVWAWAGLAASIGFIGWAGLITSTGVHPDTAGDTTARAVSVWLLVVAVIAAGLIEPRKSAARPAAKAHAGSTTAVGPSSRTSKTGTGPAASKPPAASKAPAAAGPKAGPETAPTPGRPLHLADSTDRQEDVLLPDARAAAEKIRDRGDAVTKRTLMAELKAAGVQIGDKRALDLLKGVA